MIDVDYRYAAVFLGIAYGAFRVASFFIGTMIKLLFLFAFIALGILAMSSVVGLS